MDLAAEQILIAIGGVIIAELLVIIAVVCIRRG
jgi:hypothetical protein